VRQQRETETLGDTWDSTGHVPRMAGLGPKLDRLLLAGSHGSGSLPQAGDQRQWSDRRRAAVRRLPPQAVVGHLLSVDRAAVTGGNALTPVIPDVGCLTHEWPDVAGRHTSGDSIERPLLGVMRSSEGEGHVSAAEPSLIAGPRMTRYGP
jgi:hypothetical protein